ncbi:hypothetical protein HZA76_02975 [Candidatus Roizmanbacteria bacterium]|nr:hypothetical protein [Candidatus Roizmanbacteria bacterium]
MKRMILVIISALILFVPLVIGQETRQNINAKAETSNVFQISGPVSLVNENSFIILEELIVVNTDESLKFIQEGNIKVGDFVSVQGVIKNKIKIAESIHNPSD